MPTKVMTQKQRLNWNEAVRFLGATDSAAAFVIQEEMQEFLYETPLRYPGYVTDTQTLKAFRYAEYLQNWTLKSPLMLKCNKNVCPCSACGNLIRNWEQRRYPQRDDWFFKPKEAIDSAISDWQWICKDLLKVCEIGSWKLCPTYDRSKDAKYYVLPHGLEPWNMDWDQSEGRQACNESTRTKALNFSFKSGPIPELMLIH